MSNDGRERGTVKRIWQDRGFGFIRRPAGQPDVFLHITQWRGDAAFDEQLVERDVSFRVAIGRDGRPAAFDCWER